MTDKLDHIAFIMDGHNRFAKKKKISKFNSYKLGAEKIIYLSNYIFSKYDVKYISAFALSSNNLKRSSNTLNQIMKVLSYFLNEKASAKKINYNIEFRGNLSFLPKNLVKKINELKYYNKFKKSLILYINYSGIDDILNAAKNSKNSKLSSFKKLLVSKNIPDPDLLIRTGGYQRISNFFLFQISFTELAFLKKLWPELGSLEIDKQILNFYKIERKFGI